MTFLTGSGRLFSASEIWPKCSGIFGKTRNFLNGYGICRLLGMRDTLFSVTRSLLPCYPVTVLGIPKKAIRERWEEASLLFLAPSHRAPRALFFFLPASLRHKEASGGGGRLSRQCSRHLCSTSGLSPLLVGRNTTKNVLSTFLPWNVAKMSGEFSNCSKIREFVDFSPKIPEIF